MLRYLGAWGYNNAFFRPDVSHLPKDTEDGEGFLGFFAAPCFVIFSKQQSGKEQISTGKKLSTYTPKNTWFQHLNISISVVSFAALEHPKWIPPCEVRQTPWSSVLDVHRNGECDLTSRQGANRMWNRRTLGRTYHRKKKLRSPAKGLTSSEIHWKPTKFKGAKGIWDYQRFA